MREIRTSGLMSGDGKRGGAVAPVLAPILDSTGILKNAGKDADLAAGKATLLHASQDALDGGAHALIPRGCGRFVGERLEDQAARIDAFRQRGLSAERQDSDLLAERDGLHRKGAYRLAALLQSR